MRGPLGSLHRAVSSARALRVLEPLLRRTGSRRRTTGPGLRGVRRVLVVRLDKIGDVVLFSPFLRELRRNLPRAWITVVAGPEGIDLLRPCPHVDEVLRYDPRGRTRFWRLLRHGRALALAAGTLWRRRFDLAICGRYGADEDHGVALAYLAGARRRAAWDEHVAGGSEVPYPDLAGLVTETFESTGARHEADRNLDLLRRLGGTVADASPELWWTPRDERRARETLAIHAVARPFVAIAPGAGAPKRRWPTERFAAVADRLARDRGLAVLLLGGPGEERLSGEVRSGMRAPATDLTGRLSVREAGRVLARAVLFVGNDSGLAHVAAAAGAAVVAVSCHPSTGGPRHSNAPDRFGPRGAAATTVSPAAPRAPCVDGCDAREAHCILDVSMEDVFRAATGFVREGS